VERVSQSLGEHRQFVGSDAERYGRGEVYKDEVRMIKCGRKQYSPKYHESGVVSGTSDHLNPEERTK